MSPRPAPDLDLRRDQVIRAARDLAESDGWAAVTMRRLAGELGVTQPVVYSAFDGRQALIDAVALNGFGDLAAALEAVDASPMARMRAYLDFAAAHPALYEAMFSLPSGLAFGDRRHPGTAPACVPGHPRRIPGCRRNPGGGRLVGHARPGHPPGQRAPAPEPHAGPA